MTDQKLYSVDVWFNGGDTIMVAADDGDAAEELAKSEVDLGGTLDELTAEAVEIERLEDVPENWQTDYPYGDSDETCEEWFTRLAEAAQKLAAEEAAQAPDPRQLNIPETEDQ